MKFIIRLFIIFIFIIVSTRIPKIRTAKTVEQLEAEIEELRVKNAQLYKETRLQKIELANKQKEVIKYYNISTQVLNFLADCYANVESMEALFIQPNWPFDDYHEKYKLQIHDHHYLQWRYILNEVNHVIIADIKNFLETERVSEDEFARFISMFLLLMREDYKPSNENEGNTYQYLLDIIKNTPTLNPNFEKSVRILMHDVVRPDFEEAYFRNQTLGFGPLTNEIY